MCNTHAYLGYAVIMLIIINHWFNSYKNENVSAVRKTSFHDMCISYKTYL
jgi:hypothetical protein